MASFYGTTSAGGPPDIYGDTGGTVFKITPDGTFTTIYIFREPSGATPNGEYPAGNLIKGADGNFYGTTFSGNGSSDGTVFQIATDGVLTTLHSFGLNSNYGTNYDGSNPQAGVVQGTDGNFYGTTTVGGAYGQGTVFQLTPGGVLTTLHSFTSWNDLFQNADGAEPSGELVQGDDGNFYGTTYLGGDGDGGGTIFRITPGGEFTTLVSFSGTNGNNPIAGLCKGTDGNFYGTTYSGGGATGGSPYGTVFQMTTNGVLTTLHQFTGGDDGEPVAKLIQGSDGKFYGTTSYDTVFQITTNGTFAVLHTFSGLDGNYPRASLVQGTDGNFYGTTTSDGATYNPLVEPSG